MKTSVKMVDKWVKINKECEKKIMFFLKRHNGEYTASKFDELGFLCGINGATNIYKFFLKFGSSYIMLSSGEEMSVEEIDLWNKCKICDTIADL